MDCLVLDWVKTFLAVYRAGSVTAASRSLHLTQPTVSQHLKALESHLGRPLFDRLPRGVSPTPTGYELAASIGPHLDMIESLLESARAQPAGRWTGVVRLGGPADLIATAVVPSLAAALDDGIKLRIRLGLTDELIDGLRGRELDLVLATLQRRARGIEYEPIYKEEFVLVAGARWAARISRRSLQRQGATALADAPILAYAEHLPLLRRYWEKVFGTRLASRRAWSRPTCALCWARRWPGPESRSCPATSPPTRWRAVPCASWPRRWRRRATRSTWPTDPSRWSTPASVWSASSCAAPPPTGDPAAAAWWTGVVLGKEQKRANPYVTRPPAPRAHAAVDRRARAIILRRTPPGGARLLDSSLLFTHLVFAHLAPHLLHRGVAGAVPAPG
jgi:DNA-binding transcriptional LysR family regulator